MMRRARMPSSRVVTFVLGSGKPLELPNTDLASPISRARCVSLSAKSASLPAIPSASTMQASLPDWMIMPCSRSSTGILLWIAANMVEPCEGAPPLRQAFSLTVYSSVGLMRPSLISWNTNSAVISLARLAGKMSWSGSRSNSTPPFSASIRIACGALMTGSSLLRGASFFGATAAAGLAGLTSCLGAAKASALKATSKAAAVSSRPIALDVSAIINVLSPAREARHGGIISGDVAEICGSVKAAAAQESRTAIIARRGIGGNRRSLRLGGGQRRPRDGWRGLRAAGGGELDGPRRYCRHLTGALAQSVGPVGRRRHVRQRPAIEISRSVRLAGGHQDRRARARHAFTQGRRQLAVVGAFQRRAADIFDLHLGDAFAVEAQNLGGLDRQVDDPVTDIGTAVVDAHYDRAVIGQIGDARIGRQRHGRMRGRNRIHVEDFAVGGIAAVEIVAVPGGQADGAVIHVFLRDIFAAAHRIRLADPVDAAALWHRLAIGDDAGAGGNAVFGIDPAGQAARAIGECQAASGQPDKARDQAKAAFAPESAHAA